MGADHRHVFCTEIPGSGFSGVRCNPALAVSDGAILDILDWHVRCVLKNWAMPMAVLSAIQQHP